MYLFLIYFLRVVSKSTKSSQTVFMLMMRSLRSLSSCGNSYLIDLMKREKKKKDYFIVIAEITYMLILHKLCKPPSYININV